MLNAQPSWWNEEKHGSAWERVKKAMKRDWEQTKNDLARRKGAELNQDVDDTVKQAAGKQPIPPPSVPNAPSSGSETWDDVETPVAFGYGARDQYGARYPQWNDELEGTLRTDWEGAHRGAAGRTWEDVKIWVRMGLDRSRPRTRPGRHRSSSVRRTSGCTWPAPPIASAPCLPSCCRARTSSSPASSP